MDKTGTCANCTAQDVKIMAFGLCRSCYDAQYWAKERKQDVAEALVKAKERFLNIMGGPAAQPQLAETQPPPPAATIPGKRRVSPCAACGKPASIKGQGMCGPCYWQKVEKPNREVKAAAKIMPVKALTTNAEKYPDLPAGFGSLSEISIPNESIFESPKELKSAIGDPCKAAWRHKQDSLDLALNSLRHTITIKKPSAVEEKTDEQALITLAFRDDTDMRIFSFIEAEAKRTRRTTDQQALWMLQSHLPESRAAIFYKAHGDQNEHKSHDTNPGPL